MEGQIEELSRRPWRSVRSYERGARAVGGAVLTVVLDAVAAADPS